MKLVKSCLYFALTLLLAGCASAQGRKVATEASRDPNASTVIAEIALERGDCRSAAETYAAAAQKGDLAVARRSVKWRLPASICLRRGESVKRWRALAPKDSDANTIYATVALKQLYQLPEATSALATVFDNFTQDGEQKLAELSSSSCRKRMRPQPSSPSTARSRRRPRRPVRSRWSRSWRSKPTTRRAPSNWFNWRSSRIPRHTRRGHVLARGMS